jgi:hypothetical protein
MVRNRVLGLVKIDRRAWVSSTGRQEMPRRPAVVAGARQVFRPACGLQGEGEAFIVVPGLPAAKGGRGGLEVREALPAPELLLIDSVAPLDFAVLFRPPGSNVVMADAGGLDPEVAGHADPSWRVLAARPIGDREMVVVTGLTAAPRGLEPGKN